MPDLGTSKRGGLDPIWGIASQTTEDNGAEVVKYLPLS
jgi:hypothetical protein